MTDALGFRVAVFEFGLAITDLGKPRPRNSLRAEQTALRQDCVTSDRKVPFSLGRG